MAELSGEIIQELSRVLRPFMWDKQQRQSYLVMALGTNANVLNRLVWDTSVDVFIPQMVKEIVTFGEIASGKPALCTLLEVIRENVGVDIQPKIDNLLRKITEELLEEPHQQKVNSEINTNHFGNEAAKNILTKVFKTAPFLDDWHKLETELNNWLAQVSSSININTIQSEYNFTGAIISVNFVERKINIGIEQPLKARIFHGLSDAIVYKEIFKFSETKIKSWNSNVTSLLIGQGAFGVVIFQPSY
ncbi:hypothetical protein WA1_02605 [Scytonema hofmannii PCC 7110]|uniref:Effector-associated domain-containing protein n=1 Tax=Scytonema hofmannii PCC 7110 TaxID=128403 RepID=A0A139XH95_9CYAN|nr:hypothetical protein [Scytonema hofmannii]KYC44051.1 hypothetical protein WA1_02605 [Scytonema hofmannii PCC 7110]